jgi:hypothetical protein
MVIETESETGGEVPCGCSLGEKKRRRRQPTTKTTSSDDVAEGECTVSLSRDETDE